jgi:hypothetical protein
MVFIKKRNCVVSLFLVALSGVQLFLSGSAINLLVVLGGKIPKQYVYGVLLCQTACILAAIMTVFSCTLWATNYTHRITAGLLIISALLTYPEYGMGRVSAFLATAAILLIPIEAERARLIRPLFMQEKPIYP